MFCRASSFQRIQTVVWATWFGVALVSLTQQAQGQSLTRATIRPISTPRESAQRETGATTSPYDWNSLEHQIEFSPQEAPLTQPGATSTDKLLRPISTINLDIRSGDQKRPQDRSIELLDSSQRDWSTFEPVSLAYLWEAPNIRYQPLYFEDIALERYGQTCRPGQQVAQSAIHFGVSFLTLPYHLMIDPSWNCDTNYGYCRPGSDTPLIRQRFLYPY